MRRILYPLILILLLAPVRAESQDSQGFIYGRVETRSGNEYEGILRWGNQEAFWGDLFNATKEDVPWLEEMEDQLEDGGSSIKVFGWKLKLGSGHSGGRVFMARFGDIDRIEVKGDDEGVLVMKGGAEFRIKGGSDDVGHKITVKDGVIGEITLHWEKIKSIQFLSVPREVKAPAHRLYGTLSSDAGVFEGFIQWDSQECLSTDELDGNSRDGDLAIQMGRIQSIERASRRGALVRLKDGREMELRGTNDVNDDNRGIFVEVDGLGRVRVYWDEFERVDFSEAPGSGPAYDDYPPLAPLYGTVRDRDGESRRGAIILDLDEEYGFEFLHGERYGVDYYLPLALVRSIEPDGHDASKISLVNGDGFVLEKGQDVGERNAGVVSIPDTQPEKPVYLAWEDIVEIVFEPQVKRP